MSNDPKNVCKNIILDKAYTNTVNSVIVKKTGNKFTQHEHSVVTIKRGKITFV